MTPPTTQHEPRTWTGRPEVSDIGRFWTAPIAERTAAFAALRARVPVSFFAEPEMSFLPRGAGYWALTRLDDLVTASRTASIFTSGRGATSIADMPPEFLEFFGSGCAGSSPAASPRNDSRGSPSRCSGRHARSSMT